MNVVQELDHAVDDFVRTNRLMQEPLTAGRARAFVKQHRLNTRQRNSVLKLRVATNIPDWDLKIDVIRAASQEVVADDEFGQGRPHWAILEELGRHVGLTTDEMRAAQPSDATRLCWLAWEALMSNRHWLEGLTANTCCERANVPGYGDGRVRALGWFGMERERWAELFGLSDEHLEFFGLHTEADIAHSNLGWRAVAEHAERLHMEEQVVEACRLNLLVWRQYLDGIAALGDAASI